MSNKGLGYGLNITKKPLGNKPGLVKRRPQLNSFDDSGDEDGNNEVAVEEIGEFGGLSASKPSTSSKSSAEKSKNGTKSGMSFNLSGKKSSTTSYGDLSSSLTSKKHADAAAEQDPSIYDYDSFHDSVAARKQASTSTEDKERKPKYMSNLIAAAAVRKRDALIAEEKRLARERETEGDEFADKEKFVTSAYKRQQEENRRLEQEEREREEAEMKNNKSGGMTGFYKNLLARGEERHAEVVKAAEDAMKTGLKTEKEDDKEKTEAEIAKEINEKRKGAIAVNDEGEVVDKRQLLTGGLNIASRPNASAAVKARKVEPGDRRQQNGPVGAGANRQAMRERQSRMIEEQLEQATKRALEEEEDEKAKIERAAKTRKTEGEISSAKERYLARKREAEEAKKKGNT